MKTVIGAFDTNAQAENAARALTDNGILRDDISVIANNTGGTYAPYSYSTDTVVEEESIGHDVKVGAEWGAGIGFLVGLTGFALPGLGWIAAAGWFAGTILGAGTGAIIGGLVGALTYVGVPHEEATHYTEAVRRGSVLIVVRADDSNAPRIANILNNAGAINIEERGAMYRQEGWLPSHAEAYTGNGVHVGNGIPGIQTGGHAIDGTPDTRGITEKVTDTLTGDRIDDKTGKVVR